MWEKFGMRPVPLQRLHVDCLAAGGAAGAVSAAGAGGGNASKSASSQSASVSASVVFMGLGGPIGRCADFGERHGSKRFARLCVH